jgi:hypothetical protein
MDARAEFYRAKLNLAGLEPTKRWVFVGLAAQKLWAYEGERVLAEFPVSTSVAPPSCAYGSGGTPLGLHEIAEKIGDGVEWGTIFEKREAVGVWKRGDPDGKALITSRILWLRGLEEGKNLGYECGSYNRKIYIHGTNREELIGKPASAGCVELTNDDIIALFEMVSAGEQVLID